MDDIRTTCYTANAQKLARVLGIDPGESADSVLKAAIARLESSGQSEDLTMEQWLRLGRRFLANDRA